MAKVERGEASDMSETGPDRRRNYYRRIISQALIDSLDAEPNPEELARKLRRIEEAAKVQLKIMPEVQAAIERAKRRL